jgi:hypothetical protein
MATRSIREQGGNARPGLTAGRCGGWSPGRRSRCSVTSPRLGSPGPAAWCTRPLVVAVAPGSWKAGHVAADGRVAVTVTVRRGGILSLVVPIPPATISFHGMAVVHPAGSPQARSLLDELGSLVPAERRASACVIEVVPAGPFRTFGVGVSLRTMLNPAAAQARVPVALAEDTR